MAGEFDFGLKFSRTLESIEDSAEITDHNQQLIEDYHRDRKLNGISNATQQKHLAYLKQIAEWALLLAERIDDIETTVQDEKRAKISEVFGP